jgi:hypothetical protein
VISSFRKIAHAACRDLAREVFLRCWISQESRMSRDKCCDFIRDNFLKKLFVKEKTEKKKAQKRAGEVGKQHQKETE